MKHSQTKLKSSIKAAHILIVKNNIGGQNMINQLDETDDALLTKPLLAAKLKYSVSYINKLMRQLKIPYLKIGKSVRFKLNDVMAALERESAV